MGVVVLPYVLVDGMPVLRDSELLGLYRRMQAEGLARCAYPDGPEHWLAEMKSRRSLLHLVLVDGVPGGLLWLNDFRGRMAQCHLVVFRDFQGRRHLDKGRDAVRQVLNARDARGRFFWDGFTGLIPVWNRLAVRYALACGFQRIGTVPFGYYNVFKDRSEPAEMLVLERDGGE